MKKFFLFLITLLYINMNVRAQGYAAADTTANTEPHFRPSALIVPAALTAVGATGLWVGGVKDVNRHVANGFQDLRGNHRTFDADDYLEFLPYVAYEGMGLLGVSSRHNFRDRLMAGITAELAVEIICGAWKYSVNEIRPDGERHSFPSGHTARAFAGAELIRLDYGKGPAIAAYVFATGIGAARLYNNRHWLTDVIAGAGIGVLSARIGHWMIPVYRRWFGWNDKTAIALLPTLDPVSQSAGIALAARL